MNIERWAEIPGFEGLYEVSDSGRVRSIRSGKIRKSAKNYAGYEKIVLSRNGTISTRYVHRLVAGAFVSGCGPEVNHKDGHKTNNSHENLEWCSRSRNMKHAFTVGLRKTRLSPSLVETLRKQKREGMSYVQLSRLHSIPVSTIFMAAKGLSWAYG